MEKFFLGTFFADDELDIIDQKNIIISVFFTEFRGGNIVFVTDRVDQFVRKFFGSHIQAQKVIDYIRETAERIQTPEGTVTAATMLERFLFTPELQWNRIEKLSGGERKRLYLLKILMTAPNILLLDEPTNDLDIVTLTILEDYLKSFSGAVIAISHDRYFLDKMASEIWELPGLLNQSNT